MLLILIIGKPFSLIEFYLRRIVWDRKHTEDPLGLDSFHD